VKEGRREGEGEGDGRALWFWALPLVFWRSCWPGRYVQRTGGLNFQEFSFFESEFLKFENFFLSMLGLVGFSQESLHAPV